MISARIEKDSISYHGVRLTTFVLTYPRFIHSEVMTHRMWSRNAASSRAIPFARMVEMVKENTAMPIHWGSHQKGMQSGAEVADVGRAKKIWVNAMYDAIHRARELDDLGVHKSISNRLLEPFAHMTTIVTATEFGNFFHLRADEPAMPEFRALAFAMLELYMKNTPTEVNIGDWHLPLVDLNDETIAALPKDALVKMSVARCARVSYVNFKDSTVPRDIELHDRLAASGHWSPFEHVATPLTSHRSDELYKGNFRGWLQYRKMFTDENINSPDLDLIMARKEKLTV